MKSRELQQWLATATGRTLSDVDLRCRQLREALKIPTGPRGIHAAHMDEGETLLHVLCMVSRRAADAYEVANRLLSRVLLVDSREFPDLSDFFRENEHDRFALFMVAAMKEGFRSARFIFRQFEIADDGRTAWLTFDRGSVRNGRLLFSEDGSHLSASDLSAFDRQQIGYRFVIGAGQLKLLGEQVRAAFETGDAEKTS